jgi:hypothetical protein
MELAVGSFSCGLQVRRWLGLLCVHLLCVRLPCVHLLFVAVGSFSCGLQVRRAILRRAKTDLNFEARKDRLLTGLSAGRLCFDLLSVVRVCGVCGASGSSKPVAHRV